LHGKVPLSLREDQPEPTGKAMQSRIHGYICWVGMRRCKGMLAGSLNRFICKDRIQVALEKATTTKRSVDESKCQPRHRRSIARPGLVCIKIEIVSNWKYAGGMCIHDAEHAARVSLRPPTGVADLFSSRSSGSNRKSRFCAGIGRAAGSTAGAYRPRTARCAAKISLRPTSAKSTSSFN